MTRFLHTADWQLGVEARHVAQAGQAVREARLATVQLLLQVCRREQAEFVVVAGDVCEDNGVSDELVHRLLRILEGAPAPVLLLPGNYDGLWVPQGAGREEPALVEELRSRLQAGVGGLALSRKESELLRCLEARQAAIFQEKRGAVSTGSELARLRGQVSEARQELSRLESLREAADRAASELTEVRQARESLEQRQAELSAEEQRLSTICESARLYRDQLERLCAAQAVARSTFEAVDLFRQRLIGLQTTMREQTVLADALTQRQTSLERELDEALLSYARVRQRVAELQDEATRLEQRQEWARALEELGAELRGGGEPFAGPESDPSTALPELGRTHADTRRRLAECTGELQSAQVALEELRRAECELALDRQGAVLALQAARRDLEEILSRYGAAESLLSAWREARQELDRAEDRLAEHRERAPAQEGGPRAGARPLPGGA